MDNDVKYGRPRKELAKAKRHPLNVIFDPFYPLIVAMVSIAVIVWFFEIPTQRFLGLNLSQLIRQWMP